MEVNVRKLASALLILSLGAAACGGGGGEGEGDAEEGPIKLGLITSLTGNYAPLGTNDDKGVKLAVDQINQAGGINGRKLEVIVKNDQTSPDQAAIAFNDLLGQEVDAVIGPVFSNSSLAVIPLAERNKMPFVSTSASDQQVQPIRKYAFMTPPLASQVAERHLQHFQAEGMTKIAIAHDTQSAYAVTGYNETKKRVAKYGVELVADETFETTTSDFSSLFTHVRESGAEALLVWVTGAPAVVVTKQFAGADLDMDLVMTGAECSTLYTEPAGKAAEGVLLDCVAGPIGPHLPEGDLKKSVMEMATPFQERHGYYPPQFAFDAYTATRVLAKAIEKAGSTDADDIQAALENLTMVAPSGMFNYRPDKHHGLVLEDVSVVEVKDGEFVPTEWSAQELQKDFG
ncbi:MAG: ABC transporter substrate-binding protein [Streptosporangiales bacterium]|nr:ABC transporter substrate-binding protein [Streptosporangiales bacterium]